MKSNLKAASVCSVSWVKLSSTFWYCPGYHVDISYFPWMSKVLHVWGRRTRRLKTTLYVRGCIQKFPDWQPGARTANGTALCHKVQLYRYFVSQYSEFCRHNLSCCFSTSVYCCKCIFRYRISLETFWYTLVCGNSRRYRLSCPIPGGHSWNFHLGPWILIHPFVNVATLLPRAPQVCKNLSVVSCTMKMNP